MERLRQDLRHALRVLRNAPGFTIVAFLCLTLGIGGTATMFSVVNGVLLRPLRYRDPGDLVAISSWTPSLPAATPAFPLSAYYFSQWQARAKTVEAIAAVGFGTTPVLAGDEPERVRSVRVSANLFSLLGVQPQHGRTFLETEDQDAGAARVAILSDGLWARRFGRNPETIGTKIQLNGQPYEVVGVMPPDFRFPKNDELHRMIRMPDQVDVWTPLVFTPQEVREYFSADYAGIARLKRGVSVSASEAELNGILKQSPMPPYMKDLKIFLNPLQVEMVVRDRQGLVLLMLAVGVVLLISCVNIANLLIARAANRSHELAVRSAIGASAFQLARMAIAESFAVSFVGAAGGAFLASWLIDIIRTTAVRLPRVDEIGFDVPSLLFTVVTTFAAAAACSAAPAWRYAKAAPLDALQDSARTTTRGSTSRRLRAGLVCVESALCVLLTILAALLIHSFIKITRLDQGFRPRNVVSATIQLYGQRYAEPSARAVFFQDVMTRLRALPGTEAVAAISTLPLSGQTNIMGVNPETSPDVYGAGAQAEYRSATRSYFETMNIPVIRGGIFEDRAGGPKTAVITEKTAKRLWPGQDPIGKRFMRRNRDEIFTITGVVADVRTASAEQDPPILVYTPLAQQWPGSLSIVARTTSSAQAIRRAVASVDRNVPVTRIRNLEDILSDAFATRRFQVLLLTCFAGIGLLLSAIGLYGMVSASVAQRRKEIGIRRALGANKWGIAMLVLSEGMRPVLWGMLAGVIGAMAAGRAIQVLLFSVTPLDFASYVLSIVMLLIAAAAACWMPIRGAMRVDPMTAIRYE